MSHRRKSSAGSFTDEQLLERLAGSPLTELGQPVSSEEDMPAIKPQPRIGRCAASHNRILLNAHAWADHSR